MNKSDLLRIASELPPGNPTRRAILDHLKADEIIAKRASINKSAVNPETEAFVAWAFERGKVWNPSSVERFIEKVTGREPVAPAEAPKPRRGPLEKGEKVIVDKYRNANEENIDECEQYHDRVGFIVDKNSSGVTVQFYRKDTDQPENGSVAFFEGDKSGKATGLYRWTPKADYQEGAVGKKILIEMVYLRGGTQAPPQRDIDALQRYIEKGMERGEHRSDIYYTGYVGKFAYNKAGQVYFTLSSQQRDRPTTINPAKGDVLYIGMMGRRPSGWKRDALEMGLLAE